MKGLDCSPRPPAWRPLAFRGRPGKTATIGKLARVALVAAAMLSAGCFYVPKPSTCRPTQVVRGCLLGSKRSTSLESIWTIRTSIALPCETRDASHRRLATIAFRQAADSAAEPPRIIEAPGTNFQLALAIALGGVEQRRQTRAVNLVGDVGERTARVDLDLGQQVIEPGDELEFQSIDVEVLVVETSWNVGGLHLQR